MPDDKHEDPVETMFHDVIHAPGYKGYIVWNGQGIMLRYEGFSQSEALSVSSGVTSLYNGCSNSMKRLMGSEEGAVENVRIKTGTFELICTQRAEFTFLVKQSFIPEPVDDEEAGGEAKAEA